MDLYPWLVFLHVAGGFGLMLGHGTSVMCALKLRRERDPGRIEAMLDLSSYSLGLFYVSLLLLLVGGIAAGFVGDHWGRLWIWSALGILIVIIAAMYTIASSYYARVRRALGQKVYGDAKDAPAPPPASSEEVLALLQSPRPFVLVTIGGVGLVTILWLMLMKPF